MYVEAENVKTIHATVRGKIPGGGGSIAVDDTLTIPGAAADAAVVGEKVNALTEDIKEQWEKIPVVFPWAIASLPFTETQISGTAEGAGFVNNPTNFVGGKTYFRYHAGPNNFVWTNPNPQTGAVTITARGYAQYGGDGTTRLLTYYDDGTAGPILWIVRNGEPQTVTVTTDPMKTLARITGNYDMENWVLLDMDVLSIVADYPAPDGTVKTVNGVEPDENGNVQIDLPDGGSADAVLCTQQELTEEQQMQARVNLGLYYKEYVNKIIANIETYIRKTDIPNGYYIFNGNNVAIIKYTDYETEGAEYQLEKQVHENSDLAGVFHNVCWFGNGNLIKNDTDLYNTVAEIEETKYTDVPFVLYAYSSDFTTIRSAYRLYIDDAKPSNLIALGAYLNIIDTENFDEVYHPVPDEYIPDSIARKTDMTAIHEDVKNLSEAIAEKVGTAELKTAVENALTEAKESGEFKGDPGQPGEPGDDYVLTEADKAEIAEEAAKLVEVPESSGGVSLGMTGAAVGQIAKITEVNESGVPTGWEPVDLPEGGSENWRLIADEEITEEVASVTYNKDIDGNPFQLTKMYIEMYLPEQPDGTGYTMYRVNGTLPTAYPYPSRDWHNAEFLWELTVWGDNIVVHCYKKQSLVSGQAWERFHDLRIPNQTEINSFEWGLFSRNVLVGTKIKIWGCDK